MDEADQLADQIVVVDHGGVIAAGSASELKSRVGADRLVLTFSGPEELDRAARAVSSSRFEVDRERGALTMATTDGTAELRELLGVLGTAGVAVETVALGRPTLDDVFLTLTGHDTSDGATPSPGGRGA